MKNCNKLQLSEHNNFYMYKYLVFYILPMQCSFLENVDGYFYYLGKTLNWVVLGVFHGDLDFYDLHEKTL